MSRTPLVPLVGIPLGRALLCPNDDTVYDAARWKACPTCENEERVFLSRLLGVGAGNGGPTPRRRRKEPTRAGLSTYLPERLPEFATRRATTFDLEARDST
jgi:hypothetical protein